MVETGQGTSPAEAAEVKAQALIEALPWIEKFSGRTIVVKCGGHAMTDSRMAQAFAEDVVFLRRVGVYPVVVHGGGPHIDAVLRRFGIEPEFRKGYRVTTRETMEIVRMVLAGQVSRELVGAINRHGPYAVGLSGEDAGLFAAARMTATAQGEPVDLGLVGEISRVNSTVVEDLLAAGRIPVVSSIASDTESDFALNVNADAAAAALASELKAEKLLVLTDVAGVYSQWPDESSVISSMDLAQLQKLLPDLKAGMIPKMLACEAALRNGVPQAHIIDGRRPHSMLLGIFTDSDTGTHITQ